TGWLASSTTLYCIARTTTTSDAVHVRERARTMRRIKKMRRLYLCGSTERDQPSIKDFVPERFLLVTLVVAAMDVVVMIAAIWLALRRWRHRRLSSDFLGAALD